MPNVKLEFSRSIGLAALFALAAFFILLLIGPVKRPEEPAREEQPSNEPTMRGMGWIDSPVEVAAIAATLPKFAQSNAFVETEVIPDQVFLWESATQVLGHPLPARNQGQVGSCVAVAGGTILEYLQLIQIAQTGEGEFREVSSETLYGGSRVEIGGGKIRGDGSVGAWALQYCQRYGITARDKYQHHDLRTYSERTCREFGQSGVPDYLEADAKKHPVRGGAQVTTVEELRKALANGYPVTVASDQGFDNVRDAEGFARAKGTWNHQMGIIGYKLGARPGFLIVNSWGSDWITGPRGPGNPPDGSFWADAQVVARMLAKRDSWAYSDGNGFPSRRLKWFFQGPVFKPDFTPKGVRSCFALAW